MPIRIEWVKKLWDHLTMEYYIAMKKVKLLLGTTTRMNLPSIMLSEKKTDTKE